MKSVVSPVNSYRSAWVSPTASPPMASPSKGSDESTAALASRRSG